jgi:hypothetical protein
MACHGDVHAGWDIMPCGGGTCRLCVQGQVTSRVAFRLAYSWIMEATCSAKHQLTFNRPLEVVPQKDVYLYSKERHNIKLININAIN